MINILEIVYEDGTIESCQVEDHTVTEHGVDYSFSGKYAHGKIHINEDKSTLEFALLKGMILKEVRLFDGSILNSFERVN